VFIRGNHKSLGPVAPRALLSAIDVPRVEYQGSGRLQLARQIADRSNPLTSRVIVNRLWHHMFGRGIVASVDNFGLQGDKPTHPELLDYLAAEFCDSDWSIKSMVRRIALTRTYRMSSELNPAAARIDPANTLLHSSRVKRLQGEAIRDAILRISGRLDLKMYGPSVPIHLTAFMDGRGRPAESGPVDGAGRRSVYVEVRRNFVSPMMLAFDTPTPFNAIGRRNQSNVPAQALILMNDPFVIQQAETWAEALTRRKESIDNRIDTIYWQALGRPPNESELREAKKFVELQARELKIATEAIMDSREVWSDFCHVVFNLKEFIFIQ
jgi:hypothetical protein